MTPNQEEHFNTVLAKAKDQFLQTLTSRIFNIEALMIEIDRGENIVPRIQTISELAHKTAGVARTLNFPDLGALALELETSIEAQDFQLDPTETWKNIRPKLDSMLNSMETALDD